MTVPWTQRAAAEFELGWLLEAIEPASEIGRRVARERLPIFGVGDEHAAEVAIGAVQDCAGGLTGDKVDALRVALSAIPDPAAAVARAVLGEVLDDVSLFELARFADGVRSFNEIANVLGRPEFDLPPLDSGVASSLVRGRSEHGGFYLTDAFDERLAPARAQAALAESAFASARDRIAAKVAREAGLDSIRAGEFILMRDRVEVLPPNVRVVRETPAYFLCELILDATALAQLERRDAALALVADLEEEVRRSLSAQVRAAEPSLLNVRDALARLDAFVARVRFALRYQTCVPRIARGPVIELTDAVFPPLELRLQAAGARYVPISLALTGAGVVTGPNMGGKSAALRMCAFAAACVALGLPVPARAARVALFDEIAWIGVGAEVGAAGARTLLSAFGREVIELREVLERTAQRRLVLLDEFARTTTPAEGAALLSAVLASLRETGACALAATHLGGIATRAGAAHFAIAGPRKLAVSPKAHLDLDAAIARIAEAMDYHLVLVHADDPPRGDALDLADVLGLDPTIVTRARAALRTS